MKKLCPYADDLWLTYKAMKKGTRITSAYTWRTFPINIYGTSVGSLWYLNVQDGKIIFNGKTYLLIMKGNQIYD